MVKHKGRLIAAGLLIVCFANCTKSNTAPGNKDVVLTALEMQKVAADNEFTIKLFKNLDSAHTGNANLFISPLSVSFAMGMAGNGSNEQTLTAINNTMNFNGFTQQQVNSYYDKLITTLPQLDQNTTFNIANSIWYKQGFNVLPQFLQTNKSYYHANIQALNFNNPSAANTINNWVNNQTNGKIASIINQVPLDAVMYLINAIYFKSTWKEKFDASKTSKQPFYLNDNSQQVQADFMDGTIDYKEYDSDAARIFELPYSNNKYSMVIVLPWGSTTLQQLVAGIDNAQWQKWISGLAATKGEVRLPKFKYYYSISLNKPLSQLGMGLAFSDQANFSGISATAPLQITEVKHKAFIDVNEAGTTAAAFTSVGFTVTDSSGPQPLLINRPFIFAIREVSSDLIVFAGKINNPLLTGE